MADRAWIESDLLSQTTALKSKAVNTSKSIAQLTEICQAQADELAAKEQIVNYLKTKVQSLEEAVSKHVPCSCATNPTITPCARQALGSLSSRKRAAEDELQAPQQKSVKTQKGSFLKAASDEMKSCIKWGGLLQVHFTVCVECDIFNKVFNGCKRTCSTADTQEPGELPQPRDTVTVTLDRDDLVRVFGAAKAGRKFRYTGKGTIEKLIVVYDRTSRTASGTGSWVFSQVAD